MGMCQANCYNDRLASHRVSIEDEQDLNKIGGQTVYMPDLRQLKTIAEEFEFNNSRYTNLVISTANSLYEPIIYEQMLQGKKLENIANEILDNLNEKSKFYLLYFMYGKMTNYDIDKTRTPEIVKNMSIYLKYATLRLFIELDSHFSNNIKHLGEIDEILITTIIYFIELFHLFKYLINKQKPNQKEYQIFYWKNVKNIPTYINNIIMFSSDNLGKVRHFFKHKGKEYDGTSTLEKMKDVNIFLIGVFKKIC